MPRICSFYGIVIAMYYRDHHPPHFHAIYAEYEAQIVIETLEMLAGDLPARALRLVQEWAGMHRAELERTGRGLRRTFPWIRLSHCHEHPNAHSTYT